MAEHTKRFVSHAYKTSGSTQSRWMTKRQEKTFSDVNMMVSLRAILYRPVFPESILQTNLRAWVAFPGSRSPRQNLISLKEYLLNVFLWESLSFHIESQRQGNRNYAPLWTIWVCTIGHTPQHRYGV